MCPRQDSNLHVFQHSHLKRARLPFRHMGLVENCMLSKRAENETRTRDPNLGKVVLYQLSYFRSLKHFNFEYQPLRLNCECKGSAFSRTDQMFLKKISKKLYFYLILSRERTKASSFLMPAMARQLRMMLIAGNTARNFKWNTGARFDASFDVSKKSTRPR